MKIIDSIYIYSTELGNTHVYENPALLSLGLLFFKWHNVQAEKLETSPESKDWSSDRVFYAARRWVIATQQVGKIDVACWCNYKSKKNSQPMLNQQI